MDAAAVGQCVHLREREIQYCREDKCWGEKIDLNSKAITMSIVFQCWCKLPQAASSSILHSIIHVCCKGNQVIITLCVQHSSETMFTLLSSRLITATQTYITRPVKVRDIVIKVKRGLTKNMVEMRITLFEALLRAWGKRDGTSTFKLGAHERKARYENMSSLWFALLQFDLLSFPRMSNSDITCHHPLFCNHHASLYLVQNIFFLWINHTTLFTCEMT